MRTIFLILFKDLIGLIQVGMARGCLVSRRQGCSLSLIAKKVYIYCSSLIRIYRCILIIISYQLSSAHVYLRLEPCQSLSDVPMELIEDCCQLVKANSIEVNILKPSNKKLERNKQRLQACFPCYLVKSSKILHNSHHLCVIQPKSNIFDNPTIRNPIQIFS